MFGMSRKAVESILEIRKEDLIDNSLFIHWNKKERLEIFHNLNKNYSIKDLSNMFKHDCTTLYQIRAGTVKPSTRLYFSFLDNLNQSIDFTLLSIGSRNSTPSIIKGHSISPELVGLIHSDGHMNLIKSGKGVIFYFCNQDKKLIRRFCSLISKSFKCSIFIKKDERDNTYYAYPPSSVARIIAKKIVWKTRNYRNLDLLEGEIPGYISGLFDGDGSIHIYKNSRIIIPTVKITTDSQYHANHINYLLAKIGVYSRISNEEKNGNTWFNVVITRQSDFLKFINAIESKHSKKSIKIKKYLENIDNLFKKS
ncbi:MAG: hypothetical protein KKE20_06755 [Nanoarchaeota archaeon]|nr:hypothetical protein [Nanoarchaeota archaeon]